jgi:predicted enzyme related to lactoylglutathione lyase
MLRGITTLNLWAEDLPAATRWYTELLGVEPYFTSEAVGLGSGYVEFRIGDYQHELGIIDRRFAPPELAAGPGGVVAYWHVDDVAATLDRLVSLGAKQLQAITERGPGFVTASVVDPFGNVLGIMFNRHYLDILGNRGGAR